MKCRSRGLDRCVALALFWIASQPMAIAQTSTSTQPTVGLTRADDSPVLIAGGDVITGPGIEPRRLDVLIRGTTIIEVGNSIVVPPGTERRDATGRFIYAGLIDAMHDVALPENSAADVDGYWNANVSPQYRAASVAEDASADEAKLRSQGVTARLLAPKDGIIKGTSCAVLLLDPKHPQRVLSGDVFQHATLTVPRGKRRDAYPNSPMGATALVRQAIYDAQWYQEALRVFETQPRLSRPEPNTGLQTLGETLRSRVVVFDTANERMTIRAAKIADEFSLDAVFRGNGHEYRVLDELAKMGRAILLPVNFPDAPNTASAAIRETSVVDWMHWHLAPENPSRLHDAGIEFCLTSDGLDDPSKFLKQVRLAVQRGLDADAALAALTTTPAKWMGIDQRTGKVQAGMFANLVIADRKLFDDDAKVIETWIAGERFAINEDDSAKDDGLVGSYKVSLASASKPIAVILKFEKKGKTLAGRFQLPKQDGESKDADSKKTERKSAELKNVIRQRDRLTASVSLRSLSDDFPAGISQLTLLTIEEPGVQPVIVASLAGPDGTNRSISLKPFSDESEDKDKDKDKKTAEVAVAAAEPALPVEVVYPLGAFGIEKPIEPPTAIHFRGATVWTCGESGILEDCDVIVRDGKITEVGVGLVTPKSAVVVNVRGKHITPGLIDCHSHVATDGGINESGQTITAEVRIGDFIDNTDIGLYRQLAGGVTTANILHGSANPIGGQNQVVKFRWGESMEAMKFAGAPAGIKFALGENVKRSSNRYPNTRMGVEQILRDQFLAARQYDAAMKSWAAGNRDSLPPRRDLQLDAIVEIQQGKRWVHCHSYRQDEIVATLDVLEEFNVRIGTLQHILEGYKVADRIAAHGAMASSFADWWAYKYEVFDAIPYNGVLMHDAGVVVSFNSDDAELARHLNTEAAKASKYGGVPEQEALKFVTLNPAKQLRIDDRVGSIEIGKDADLVVWSGRPLSTTTRCEQTWIDGRQYFSIETDKKFRERDAKLKARLVQLAIDTQPKSNSKTKDSEKNESETETKPKEIPEADRWVRFDIFCNAAQNRGENQ